MLSDHPLPAHGQARPAARAASPASRSARICRSPPSARAPRAGRFDDGDDRGAHAGVAQAAAARCGGRWPPGKRPRVRLVVDRRDERRRRSPTPCAQAAPTRPRRSARATRPRRRAPASTAREGRLAVAAARDQRDRVAVLDVAARAHAQLDRQRRRRGRGVQRGDRDRRRPRARGRRCASRRRRPRAARGPPPAAPPPRARCRRRRPPRPTRVTARRTDVSIRSTSKRPSASARSIAWARAGPAKSTSTSSAGDTVGGRGVGGGALGHRLVVHARVRPRRGDDLGVEVVHALGVLLDRQQAPARLALVERPVLAHLGRRGGLAVVHDATAVLGLDEVLGRRLDADHDAIVGVVGAVDQPDVLDHGAVVDMDAVVPALAVEVVTPSPCQASRRRTTIGGGL